MLLLNVICETTSFLRLLYFLGIARKLLFIVLPIFLIITITFKTYKNILNTNGEYKQDLKLVAKKIIAVIIIFFIPTFVNITISLLGTETKDTYKTCLDNATISKISYYKGVEEKVSNVKNLIQNVKSAPTIENLNIVEDAVSNLYGVANGSIIEDLEYELGSIRTKVTMSEEEFICKSKVGIYKDGECTYLSSSTDTTKLANNNGMVYYTFKTKNDYLVINSKISILDYMKIVESKHICQDQKNGTVYYDQCLCFAEEHMHALTTGDTSKSSHQVNEFYYSDFVKSYDDNDINNILKIVYSNLITNKPIILQVNGNKAGTSRHYVVVIGFKSTVKNIDNLEPSDFLIIDSYDGKVEQLHSWGKSRFMTTGAKCKKTYSGYQVYSLI